MQTDTEIDTMGVEHNNSSDKSAKSIIIYYTCRIILIFLIGHFQTKQTVVARAVA